MRSSKYDALKLGPIVASSHSLAEVIRTLGLSPTGGNYRHIGTRIRHLGLDTTHFFGATAARIAALDGATLKAIVVETLSIAQVLVRLDLPPDGRAHRDLVRRLEDLQIDTSHFRGQGWSRGETAASHPAVARIRARNTFSDEQVFVENSSFVGGKGVTRRLLIMGWPYRCAWCGIARWRDEPLVLHLDHINGVRNDNRLTNLRFLCPNCHSQTPTYGRRAGETDLMSDAWPCYTRDTRAWRNWYPRQV